MNYKICLSIPWPAWNVAPLKQNSVRFAHLAFFLCSLERHAGKNHASRPWRFVTLDGTQEVVSVC